MKIRKLTRRQFVALTSVGAVAACGGDDTTSGRGGQPDGGAGGSDGGAGGGVGGEGGDGGQGGSGGGMPTGPGPEPPALWDPPGQIDASAFAWGVQTGDALPTAVLVSMRTFEASVGLSIARGIEGGWEEITSMEPMTVEDGMVHVELEDLVPDTTYALTFYATDGTRRSRVARFRSAIPAGASRIVRFGATSCFGDNNDPWPCVQHTLPEKLDFFLLLGDVIYADNNPNAFDYETKYHTALSLVGLNDLTAGTSVVSTWDDHEIDNNWSWNDNGIQQKYDDALAAFRRYIPQRIGPTDQMWHKQSWGDAVDLFVLDCRGERIGGMYISVGQMSWLKDELAASTARFKVILNSVPIFDFDGTVIGPFSTNDRWQGYPMQRDEILQHIRDSGIEGVLWITGDVHFGAVGKVDQPGGPGDDAWEVIAGPAGSLVNPSALLLQENARMPVVVRSHNWVLFEADPDSGSVSVQFIGNSNQVIREITLML